MKALCIHCQVEAMAEIHGWLPVCGTRCAAIVDALPQTQRQKLIDAKRKAEKPKGNKAKKTKEASLEIPAEEEIPKLVRILKLKRNCKIVFYHTAIEDFRIELGRQVEGKIVTYYVGYHIHYGSGYKMTRTLEAVSNDYRAFVRGKPSPIPIPEAVPFEKIIPTEPNPDEPIVLTLSDDEDLFPGETSSSDEDLFGSEEEYDLPAFGSNNDSDDIQLEDVVLSEDEQEEPVPAQTSTPTEVPASPNVVPSSPNPAPEIPIPAPEKKKKSVKTTKQRLEKMIRRAKTEFTKDTKTLNIILSLIEMSKKYRLLPNSYTLSQKLSSMKYDWSKKKTPEFFQENPTGKAIIWVIRNGKGTKLSETILTGMYDVIFDTISIAVPNVDKFIELYPNAFNVKTTLSATETISLTCPLKSLDHHLFFTQFIASTHRKSLDLIDILSFANRTGIPRKMMKKILKTAVITRIMDGAAVTGVKSFISFILEKPFQSLEIEKTYLSVIGDAPYSIAQHSEGSLRLYYSQIRPFLHNQSAEFQPDIRFSNLMHKFIVELAPTTTIFPLLIEVLVNFQSEQTEYNFAHWLLHSLYKKSAKYAITVKTRLDVDTVPNGIVVQKKVDLEDPLVVTLYDVEPFFKRTIWNALKRIAEMKIPHHVPRPVDSLQFINKMKSIVTTHFRSWITPLLNVEKLETNALLSVEPPFVIEIDNLAKVNLEDSTLAHIEYVDPEGVLNFPSWAL